MVHKLFQEAGAGVHLNKFRAFLQRLQEGMLRLEFAHYDTAGAASWQSACSWHDTWHDTQHDTWQKEQEQTHKVVQEWHEWAPCCPDKRLQVSTGLC
jgi:hypothetical protein